MQDNPKLVWSPTYQYLKDKIHEKKQLYLLISPFIKLEALKSLVEICDDISNLKIVVRWSGKDILSQVTDIEIYPYLKDKAIPLYINPSVHAYSAPP